MRDVVPFVLALVIILMVALSSSTGDLGQPSTLTAIGLLYFGIMVRAAATRQLIDPSIYIGIALALLIGLFANHVASDDSEISVSAGLALGVVMLFTLIQVFLSVRRYYRRRKEIKEEFEYYKKHLEAGSGSYDDSSLAPNSMVFDKDISKVVDLMSWRS